MVRITTRYVFATLTHWHFWCTCNSWQKLWGSGDRWQLYPCTSQHCSLQPLLPEGRCDASFSASKGQIKKLATILAQWERLQNLPLAVFRSHLDLDNLLWVSLLDQGWSRWAQRSLPTSAILWTVTFWRSWIQAARLTSAFPSPVPLSADTPLAIGQAAIGFQGGGKKSKQHILQLFLNNGLCLHYLHAQVVSN